MLGASTMWGDGLRNWFELFAGMVVYRPAESGGHESDGWLSVNDIEGRFRSQKLSLQGRPYDPSDAKQRNQLLDSIVTYASLLCTAKLLERRRQIVPPSLDYRVTPFGRKVGNWGYGDKPGLRTRSVFFLLELGFRLQRYWKLVAIGAAGWAVLNAFKFYSATWAWLSNDSFALASAVAVAVLVCVGRLLMAVLHSHE